MTIKQIKKEFTLALLQLVKDKKIKRPRAAEIARLLLKALPENLAEDKFDDAILAIQTEIPELSALCHRHLVKIDQKETNEEIEKIRKKLGKREI